MILHFQDRTAYVTTAAAARLRGALDGRPGKHVDCDRYLPLRHDAARRAAALSERHARDGKPSPRDNPSSTVGDLLVAIERLASDGVRRL